MNINITKKEYNRLIKNAVNEPPQDSEILTQFARACSKLNKRPNVVYDFTNPLFFEDTVLFKRNKGKGLLVLLHNEEEDDVEAFFYIEVE